MVVTPSPHSYAETVPRLVAAIEGRAMAVFARIDHAGAARAAGLELPDEEVVIFGSPRAGTPLMQSDPRVGIELPLRVLIWVDAEGTKLGFQDPTELADEYSVAEHRETLQRMRELLGALVAEAAG
jgi:uncharacterized protein (DUF302 family)